MIRILVLISAPLLAASGCGQPEPPRFVPASATDAPATRAPSKGDGPVAIPRNIPSH